MVPPSQAENTMVQIFNWCKMAQFLAFNGAVLIYISRGFDAIGRQMGEHFHRCFLCLTRGSRPDSELIDMTVKPMKFKWSQWSCSELHRCNWDQNQGSQSGILNLKYFISFVSVTLFIWHITLRYLGAITDPNVWVSSKTPRWLWSIWISAVVLS